MGKAAFRLRDRSDRVDRIATRAQSECSIKKRSVTFVSESTQLAELSGPPTADERRLADLIGIGMPLAGRQTTALTACNTVT